MAYQYQQVCSANLPVEQIWWHCGILKKNAYSKFQNFVTYRYGTSNRISEWEWKFIINNKEKLWFFSPCLSFSFNIDTKIIKIPALKVLYRTDKQTISAEHFFFKNVWVKWFFPYIIIKNGKNLPFFLIFHFTLCI
jgi:hypothetical protein